TSVELGCANPDFPCNLPNALLDDPPLKQVVTRTIEAGLRSRGTDRLAWSAGYFHGENYNDLLFVASQQTGFGYFLNFGKTRRQGLELNIKGQLPHLVLGGGYTFLDATYQSSQTVNGASNSSNDSNRNGVPGIDGEISISPGNRIPQTPQHILKVFTDYKPTANLLIDFNLLAASSSYARGNEDNQHQPDGVYYLGPGTSPAYGVANVGAHYTFSSRLEAVVQVNNLFNNTLLHGSAAWSNSLRRQRTFRRAPFRSRSDRSRSDVPGTQHHLHRSGCTIHGLWGTPRDVLKKIAVFYEDLQSKSVNPLCSAS
ncbi:MAG TPA: TonB-dependent receptor, partial [Edaphobacter sp.]|nr:TonB-dependent receptor [Edaphobacter sp.]